MADHHNYALATQIEAIIHGVQCNVSILADTPHELKSHIQALVGTTEQAQPAQQAAPTPTPGPSAAQSAPVATPNAGPTATDAVSAGTQTAPAPATASTQPAPALDVGINDVLSVARELLQQPNGEETLRGILGQNGCESISTADPSYYAGILNGINAALGK